MNLLDRAIAAVAPGAALRRAQQRVALRNVMNYEAASVSPRTGHRRAPGTDADAAAARRGRMANLSRDMIRNTPYAARAQQVITNNVVGDGIIPKLRLPKGKYPKLEARGLQLIEGVLDTTDIDADGRQNLYGLQRLVMNTVVDAGEALVLRMPRAEGKRGPGLKLRVLEPDFLDNARNGAMHDTGGWEHEGIEYDAQGRRVAYWLFDQHPGSDNWRAPFSATSRRVPAADVLHIYRQDRAGQMRGVTWFAPIALALADAMEFQDAQLLRQKISACFVAFRKMGDNTSPQKAAEMASLSPGLVQDLGVDEDITFGTPPDSGDFNPFMQSILRSCAAGLGVTYEAFTGDLSEVNFSSARMGRIEMDRNISSWQWTMLIPGLLQPVGKWLLEDWIAQEPGAAGVLRRAAFEWVPPYRILVDPTREIPALVEAVNAGFTSRRAVVRSLGFDPERLEQDIAAENIAADSMGLTFSSDYRHARAASSAFADAALAGDDEDGADDAGGAANVSDDDDIDRAARIARAQQDAQVSAALTRYLEGADARA